MTNNPDDAEAQVLVLLCDSADPWTWGGEEGTSTIKFERNGTGELHCGQNQNSWLASGIDWSFTAKPVMAINDTWKITVKITITTRLAPVYQGHHKWLSGKALEDHLRNPPPPSEAPFPWAPLGSAAFRSKQYNLMLLRGRFIEPFDLAHKIPYPLFQKYRRAPRRYTYQLVFDVSPYPPREEWSQRFQREYCGTLDFYRYWEQKEFVRDSIDAKNKTWAEWLDFGWWLSPTVGTRANV